MSHWVPFEYREFYDVPRSIVLTLPDGRRVLLESRSAERLEEYRETYVVRLISSDLDLVGVAAQAG